MDQDAKPVTSILDAQRTMARPFAGRQRLLAVRGDAIDFLKSLGLLGLAALMTAAFFNSSHGPSREASPGLHFCGGTLPAFLAPSRPEGRAARHGDAGGDNAGADCRS